MFAQIPGSSEGMSQRDIGGRTSLAMNQDHSGKLKPIITLQALVRTLDFILSTKRSHQGEICSDYCFHKITLATTWKVDHRKLRLETETS